MVEDKSDQVDTLVNKLLVEFSENREALKVMLKDLEVLKGKIDSIFPESVDKRYRYLFEEKVKAATSFFNTLLDIRKEISKSLKDEIELRRKSVGGGESDFEKLLDIGALADKVERAQKERVDMCRSEAS